MSKIKIKRLDKSLPLPEYKTKHSAGFDLCAREGTKLKPGQIVYIPLNICMEIPRGYFVILAARSSSHKMGIMPVNGIGIIDSDYRGNEDEWKMAAYNFTKKTIQIEKGDRVAQGILVKFSRANWQEVFRMGSGNRGGFGSTGRK